MYCPCGERVEGSFKYADYCKKCNQAIAEYLEDLKLAELRKKAQDERPKEN